MVTQSNPLLCNINMNPKNVSHSRKVSKEIFLSEYLTLGIIDVSGHFGSPGIFGNFTLSLTLIFKETQCPKVPESVQNCSNYSEI